MATAWKSLLFSIAHPGQVPAGIWIKKSPELLIQGLQILFSAAHVGQG